ncbi:MAG: transposase zinc-binding domain-containing protein, partial [Acidobacteriota bacterium]
MGAPEQAATGYAPRRPETTTLYAVVQHHLETWLAQARARERAVPGFVERELREFLDCGIPANGFLRLHCDGCGLDRVVPFSCKGRGFCPSCGGRHMADTAAHLVNRVLPRVPVRQWVLSLPFGLRYRLAHDRELTAAVLRVFVRAI